VEFNFPDDFIEDEQSNTGDESPCGSPSGICPSTFDEMIRRKVDENMKWLFGPDG